MARQQWEIEREESTPQLAGYLNRRIREGEDIREALESMDLDFWKVPSSGWMGASDAEFIDALIPEIEKLREVVNVS